MAKVGLDILLDPRRWTREMSAAWHKALPDTEAAFAALRSFAKESEASPRFGDRLRAAMGPQASPSVLERWRAAEVAGEIDDDARSLGRRLIDALALLRFSPQSGGDYVDYASAISAIEFLFNGDYAVSEHAQRWLLEGKE